MATLSGYSSGGGAGGAPLGGYQMASGAPGASGAPLQGLALSTPGGQPTTVAQMWEELDRKQHPEKYQKASSAAPRPRSRGLYIPPNYGGGGGPAFGGMDSPYLPPMGMVSDLQESLQPGMFEGSITFLSVEVDPDGSELAKAVVSSGALVGHHMITGAFPRRRKSSR